jgi:hypothetical protein
MADKSPFVRNLFVFYKPTGPLSGVTSTAIAVWLISWAVLDRWWTKRNVRMSRVNILAFILLGFSVLLTYPPFADLF